MIDFLTLVLTSSIGQAIIIAVVTAVIGQLLTARGKLVWSVSHQHHYNIPRLTDDGTFPVRTQQIWVHNPGRAPVEGIEFILNWKPQHFEIWDPRKFEEDTLPDGRFALQFPSLAGKESLTISMIDTLHQLPMVVGVRWKNGMGREISMGPQQVLPQWVIFLLRVFLFLGVTAALFILLQLILALAG